MGAQCAMSPLSGLRADIDAIPGLYSPGRGCTDRAHAEGGSGPKKFVPGGLALAVSPFQGLGSKFAISRPGPYGTRQGLFRPFGPVEPSTSYAPNKCHVMFLSGVLLDR